LQPKRIVLTGAPSTGKTTVIKLLKQKGYYCFDEISREIIQEFQKKGIEAPFLSHPNEFSSFLFSGRIDQYENISPSTQLSFYDRGIHDIIAYLHYSKKQVPENFIKKSESTLYDQVFLFPPWKDIYTTDSERLENFNEACEIHKSIKLTYLNTGHFPIEVPFGTVENRVSFILNSLK